MPTPFPLFAVADQPYTVRLRYRTQVHVSDDGTEQRAMTRLVPIREEEYTVRAAGATGMALQGHGILDSLLHGAQGESLLIPYWPHGTFLGAAASAGSNVVLSVATTDRDFVVGGSALLWRDEATHEVVTIEAKSSSTITGDLAASWPAGTFVLPLRAARLSNDTDVRRLGARANEARLQFAFEAGTDPSVATPAEPEIFDVAQYRKVEPSDSYVRQVDRIENATYTFADYPRRANAGGHRRINVWLPTRASVHALEQWFHGLKGSLTPFWLPTYQQDFEVVSVDGADLTVKWIGYTDRAFISEGRRYLAFISPNGTIAQRYVESAVDNGTTETLTLDDAVPTGYTLVSYLLYVRIADDTLEYSWRNNSFADCAIEVVEIAAELEAA